MEGIADEITRKRKRTSSKIVLCSQKFHEIYDYCYCLLYWFVCRWFCCCCCHLYRHMHLWGCDTVYIWFIKLFTPSYAYNRDSEKQPNYVDPYHRMKDGIKKYGPVHWPKAWFEAVFVSMWNNKPVKKSHPIATKMVLEFIDTGKKTLFCWRCV